MKIFIIYNPSAGSARRLNRLARLQQNLETLGHTIVTFSTRQSGDAISLTRRALQEGAECVVAVGGDGTVNEVIQEMAGSDVPLAVYPAGTTNVWCQQVQMPVNPRLAAQVISSGQQRHIDLGRAGGRYFLLMMGIGWDGEVVKGINLDLKKKVGKLAYAVAAMRLFKFHGSDVSITLEPGTPTERSINLRTSLIIITNSERYAIMKLAPEARLSDGKMELLVFQGSNFLSKVLRGLSLLTSRTEHDEKIARYRMDSARIIANPPVNAQVDGDWLGQVGSQEMKIECIHNALRVIVPQEAPTHLFTN